ncbi:Uncharacterized protein FWK35_00032196, partial [Aphis craccivora]
MLQFQTSGVVSDVKNSQHFPTFFKKIEKNKKKKVTEKREFLHKASFRSNRFYLYGCNSKTNN